MDDRAEELRVRGGETTDSPWILSTIVEHHDGHGLNEALEVTRDARDPANGGASHRYEVVHIDEGVRRQVASIQFQHGPRHEALSKPGCTEAALLAILIDRLRGFQAGPYACRENALMLTKLEEALHWTRARADGRSRRGVLGKDQE